MDQTTMTLILSIMSALVGLLVGRSTIMKQNAEARKETANAGYVSVQTFALLRAEVEKMQEKLVELQQESDKKDGIISSLKSEIQILKDDNEQKDVRIADLERRLKNFIDPRPRRKRPT